MQSPHLRPVIHYDPKTVNFLQKLAQNWPIIKNHLPEIGVSG